MGAYGEYQDFGKVGVSQFECVIDDVMFMGNKVKKGCIIESFHRYGQWVVFRIYNKNGVIFLDVFRPYMEKYPNIETIRIRISDVKKIVYPSGNSSNQEKKPDSMKDFPENYFNRKQSKDYMECGNCPMWHPSGCTHTCHGTFTMGICDMISGSLFADYHECKLSAEERYDFMAKKGGELIESSGTQKDSLETRLDKIEKRLQKLEKDYNFQCTLGDSINKLGEATLDER